MKTIRHLPALCAAALLLSSLSTSAQEGKEYTIKLDRPDKAGDKSREDMKATIERSQRLTRGEEKMKEDASDMQVSLSGVLEVVEVSEKGNTRKLTFTVEQSSLQVETGAAQECSSLAPSSPASAGPTTKTILRWRANRSPTVPRRR